MKLKGKYGALVPDVTVHDVALDGQHAAGGLAVGCHTCEMDVQGGGSIVGYKQNNSLACVVSVVHNHPEEDTNRSYLRIFDLWLLLISF